MSNRRHPFNVSRIIDSKRHLESGVSLVGAKWGVFEDVTGKLVATWVTKKEALEAARQLNVESERAVSAFDASDSVSRSNEPGA